MRKRWFIPGVLLCLLPGAGWGIAPAPGSSSPASFEILTHRMDVDVDGAPNAYGPPGSHTLDKLKNAHYRGRPGAEIVGYLTEDDRPEVPVRQGPHDPFPGLYISQTAFTDRQRTNEKDILRYVDATRISYVVLGTAARRQGARLGDFVAVYSQRNHRSVYAIVGDDGNPSGDEGSLHLLQALGYPFHDGRDEAVERREITIRFFPGSNPRNQFFRSQQALDAAAERLGLSREFTGSHTEAGRHPSH
ncbi:MAG: hypothetical protein ACRYFU_02170 [Janthinobacterium lividum]